MDSPSTFDSIGERITDKRSMAVVGYILAIILIPIFWRNTVSAKIESRAATTDILLAANPTLKHLAMAVDNELHKSSDAAADLLGTGAAGRQQQYDQAMEVVVRDFLKKPDNHRGIYLTAPNIAKEYFFDEALESMSEYESPLVVFDVKGSFVYFDTSSSLAAEFGLIRPLYDLPKIVDYAKKRGFYTVARFISASDPVLAARVPEVQIRHPLTGMSVGTKWINPGHPTVLEYNRQVLRDIVTSGVDEVNLDYIRYPTEYDQRDIGLTRDEKADNLETFISIARKTIDQYGKGTKLGISTYAILGWNYEVNVKPLGQDFVRFAPLVDIISPMAYPSTFDLEGSYYNPKTDPGSRNYYLVYRTLEGYKELLGDEHSYKIRPWIQGYYMTKKGMEDQIQAVFDAGLCGFMVWNAENEFSNLYAAMNNIEVPEDCKDI